MLLLCVENGFRHKGDEVTAVWMWGAYTILSFRGIPPVLPVRIRTTGGKPRRRRNEKGPEGPGSVQVGVRKGCHD